VISWIQFGHHFNSTWILLRCYQTIVINNAIAVPLKEYDVSRPNQRTDCNTLYHTASLFDVHIDSKRGTGPPQKEHEKRMCGTIKRTENACIKKLRAVVAWQIISLRFIPCVYPARLQAWIGAVVLKGKYHYNWVINCVSGWWSGSRNCPINCHLNANSSRGRAR